MKKLIALLVCVLITLTATVGCGGTQNDLKTLNVVCLNKGYGEQWINTIAREFEKQNEGYKVKVSCEATADQLIEKNLASKHNTDDLYICVGSEWKMYALAGKFATLDDILDDQVDGVILKDKIAGEYNNSIYFPNSAGQKHTYRLPWTQGFGGIFYNEKMFTDNGWQVPSTYAELITLCQTIVESEVSISGTRDKVKPFAYTSANLDYLDYTVFTWWAQLVGYDAIKEFTQYQTPNNFDTEKSETYDALKTATELLMNIFTNKDYVHEAESNHQAQKDFNNGYAAMMLNGEWLYNEIKSYQINNANFKLAVMKTPTVPNATHNISYTIGEDQYIAIPNSSIKKDLAKNFIKLLVSDFGCKTFIDQANGLLAYDITTVNGNDISTVTEDTFMRNLYSVKASYTNSFTSYPNITSFTNVRESNAMLYLSNFIDIWTTGTMRPYKYIIDGTYTIDIAFSKIAEEASSKWPQWQIDSGVILN